MEFKFLKKLYSRFIWANMIPLSEVVEELYKFEKKFESITGCPLGWDWAWEGCDDSDIKREYFLSNRGLDNYLYRKLGERVIKVSKNLLPSFIKEERAIWSKAERVAVSFGGRSGAWGKSVHISDIFVKRIDVWRIKIDILKDAKLKNKLFLLFIWCKLKLREISKTGKNAKNIILHRMRKERKSSHLLLNNKKLENPLRRKSRSVRRAEKRRMKRRHNALKKCLLSGNIVFKAVEHYSFGVTHRICNI